MTTPKTQEHLLEMCLSHGVKIALATDSHDIAEVGELSPHVNLLRQLGVCERDLPDVLYKNVAQFGKLRPGKLPTCPTSTLSQVQSTKM